MEMVKSNSRLKKEIDGLLSLIKKDNQNVIIVAVPTYADIFHSTNDDNWRYLREQLLELGYNELFDYLKNYTRKHMMKRNRVEMEELITARHYNKKYVIPVFMYKRTFHKMFWRKKDLFINLDKMVRSFQFYRYIKRRKRWEYVNLKMR